jgi:putative sterol carrier protein
MKIVLLQANTEVALWGQLTTCIIQVLQDLSVEVVPINLKEIPYFTNQPSAQMQPIIELLEEAKGIIAMCTVHIAGMHSAMHNFFEHMTHYDESIKNKPLFTLTYTDYTGEVEAANQMLFLWSTLGGLSSGSLAFHKEMTYEEIAPLLERNLEDFYRVIKQERKAAPSTTRNIYLMLQDNKAKASATPMPTMTMTSNLSNSYNLSTASNLASAANLSTLPPTEKLSKIKGTQASALHQESSSDLIEITRLLKEQISKQGTEEATLPNPTRVIKPTSTGKTNLLSSIPHAFVAQHQKDLQLKVQYHLTESDIHGALVIADGECHYQEGQMEDIDVDIVVSDDILKEVLKKKLTYQKAFMIGKMKVRGNFALLAKLDQIFKAT